MKKLLTRRLGLLICFLMLAGKAGAQAPGWQMAVAIGTTAGNSLNVNATAVDASGNVFITGSFTGTATFGATTLTSTGLDNLFVAKWRPATGFVWAQPASGTNHSVATALVVSGGSVYVAGHFYSPTIRFGATTLTNAVGIQSDVFVAKLTDGGSTSTWIWALSAGGIGEDVARTLAVSGDSVYVAGDFTSPTSTFGATTLQNVGLRDVFVAKLTDGGSTSAWTWAQQAAGMDGDYAYTLAVSGGSVYVAGFFQSPTIRFGATTLQNVGSSGSDIFVAKLTDAGSTSAWTWVQQADGTDGEYARALAVSGSSVYVAGYFDSSTIRFGATTLQNVGGLDVFVAKLTDGGNTSAWTWAQQAAGTDSGMATALAVSGGSVYMTGYFYSPTITFGVTTLQNAGSPGTKDVFVAKLTDGGNTSAWTWALPAGGTGDEEAHTLAVSRGSVYVAGYFVSPALAFGATTLTTSGASGFLAALTDAALATPADAAAVTLTLAPNPAQDAARLRGAAPAVPLTLRDTLGRVVLTTTADADGAATLEVRGLAAGLYWLMGEGGAVRRLVVE